MTRPGMRCLGPGSLILATGGAGFLGAAVVQRLVLDGFRVRVLDDLSTGHRARLEELDVEVIVNDVRAERGVREACAGVQGIVHLASAAAIGSPRAERLAHEVNVTGTLNLLMAARAARVSRFVFTSSHAVYGAKAAHLLHEDISPHPTCADGAQKLAAKEYVRLFGFRDALQACVLRLFSVYGPGQDAHDGAPQAAHMLQAAAAHQPVTLLGDGSHTADLLFVNDAIHAIAAALVTPGVTGRTVNIASGESVGERQLLLVISELCDVLPPRYAPARPGEAQSVRASIAVASSALGFRPRTRLKEGLHQTLTALGCEHLRPLRARDAHATPNPLLRSTTPLPTHPPTPAPPARSRTRPPPPPQPARSPLADAAEAAEASPPPLFSDRPPSWAVPDSGYGGPR